MFNENIEPSCVWVCYVICDVTTMPTMMMTKMLLFCSFVKESVRMDVYGSVTEAHLFWVLLYWCSLPFYRGTHWRLWWWRWCCCVCIKFVRVCRHMRFCCEQTNGIHLCLMYHKILYLVRVCDPAGTVEINGIPFRLSVWVCEICQPRKNYTKIVKKNKKKNRKKCQSKKNP